MNEELTPFILKELSKRRDGKEIIRRVCEQAGLHSREAARLIILLEARHRPSIATHQTPWLLFLSVGVLLLGIGSITGLGMIVGGLTGLWKAFEVIFPK